MESVQVKCIQCDQWPLQSKVASDTERQGNIQRKIMVGEEGTLVMATRSLAGCSCKLRMMSIALLLLPFASGRTRRETSVIYLKICKFVCSSFNKKYTHIGNKLSKMKYLISELQRQCSVEAKVSAITGASKQEPRVRWGWQVWQLLLKDVSFIFIFY